MKPLLFKAILMLPLLFVPSDGFSQAKKKPGPADVVLNVFTRTCLATDSNPAKLKEMFAPGKKMALPQLPPEAAQLFLAGRPGMVWAVPSRILGDAVLSVLDAGVCSMFVRRWAGGEIEQRLRRYYAHKNVFSLKEVSRRSDQMNTVMFDIVPAGQHRQILLQKGKSVRAMHQIAISTSNAPNKNFQFVISHSRK